MKLSIQCELWLLSQAGLGTLESRPVHNISEGKGPRVQLRREERDQTLPLRRFAAVVAVAVAFVCSGVCPTAHAQSSRTAQLSKMLRHSDFRVRTQAAFSLGRIDDPSAVRALLNVLDDDHPAVRAAAAVALGRIGDSNALARLREHRDSSGAVRIQVNRAISLIEANNPTKVSLDWTGAHHYLELDSVTNTSKTKRPGIDDLLHSLAMREMRRLRGIVAVDSKNRPADANRQIKQLGIKGYAISVSLGRLVRYMGPHKVRVQAEVMLAVVTYPGRVYRMTANGTGAVTIPRESFRIKQVPALQEDALSGALNQAFRSLGKALETQASNQSRRRNPSARRR